MARAFLVVLDSVGCGGAPDADRFFNGDLPDVGANTLGHIAQFLATQPRENGEIRPLRLNNLDNLGLSAALALASGEDAPNLGATPIGAWGVAREISPGKDTPSGHWEIAGVPVPWDWHFFTDKQNSFPPDVVDKACEIAGTDGILGNCHASGTEIIAQLGGEHIRTGWPICYTSADSVFQIAAHEDHFGLENLLNLCRGLAPFLHEMRVGRVIARPFVGDVETGFTRTQNRRDFAVAPPHPTLCDWVQGAGRTVYAIGKIGDIFSMRGIDHLVKGSDADLFEHLVDHVKTAEDGSLTFANFVEFDSLYGHRRDPVGYGAALEWFDAQLPRLFEHARVGDMILFTADHGNDPTWPGTDHTREQVPVLIHGAGPRAIGCLQFSDVSRIVADHLGVSPITGDDHA